MGGLMEVFFHLLGELEPAVFRPQVDLGLTLLSLLYVDGAKHWGIG
jgi:hypothetical protein